MIKYEYIIQKERAIQILQDAGKQQVVALDCEGYHYGHENGRISLVQIAYNNVAYLLDVQVLEKDALFCKAMQKFATSKVLKIMQDCRKDLFHMHDMFQVIAENVFDIQVAHKQVHGGPNTGIADLIPFYLDVEHESK